MSKYKHNARATEKIYKLVKEGASGLLPLPLFRVCWCVDCLGQKLAQSHFLLVCYIFNIISNFINRIIVESEHVYDFILFLQFVPFFLPFTPHSNEVMGWVAQS